MNKTFRMALLLLLSPGISLAGWSQTKQVFAVTDRSEVTGVLQISGTVSSSEQYIANQLVSSCGIEAGAKNISGKPILLVIAALDVRAPLGGRKRQSAFVSSRASGRSAPAVCAIRRW